MITNVLYRALYVLVHCVFTAYELLFGALNGIGAVFVDFCHEFGYMQRTNYLKSEIAKTNKIPKHLTVLLGKEEPSYTDLANIVVWCLINHIFFLSFYDYKGILKNHQDKLEEALRKKLSSDDHVTWHSSPASTYKNGFIGRKIHIKILSRENGKASIVKLTRDLCETPTPIDYSVETVDHALQKDFEFPDPDLGLSCGSYLNFFDYPPWQMRVTEFLSIGSHYRIRYRKFLKHLYIYGKCEQRLGK